MLRLLNKNLISVLFKRLSLLPNDNSSINLDVLSLTLNKISDIVSRFSLINYINYYE